MALSIGFFGAYSVDEQGRFAGNRVEGERMYETFTRPDGGRLRAEFVRVR
nr:hypothetical protein [Pseudomonas sp.]